MQSAEELLTFKAFMRELADAARGETLRRWALGIAADDKSGGSAFDPVTEADREAERVMRGLIEARYPDHGIAGEEFPDKEPAGPFLWSLDPIDGTRSFICGMPTWVTLIALLEEGAPAVGLIDVPRLGERYLGDCERTLLISAEGETRLSASGCDRLADARFSTTDPFLFTGAEADPFAELQKRVRTTRYGHDGYAYARLAAGSIDLVVETGLKTHDYNALIPVVRGSGGVIGNWSGGNDFAAGQVVAAATPRLYDEAVALLNASSWPGAGR
jgi:myo-inositol-1(or 4)-monophosphatase